MRSNDYGLLLARLSLCMLAASGTLACRPADTGGVDNLTGTGSYERSSEVVAPRDPELMGIFDLVNRTRRAPHTCGYEGSFPPAPALLWNKRLAVAAQAGADDLAVHEGVPENEYRERVKAQGYIWSYVGENTAAGQPSPEQVVSYWLESPSHCANLMSQGFTQMGVGRATGKLGVYWSLTMARPLSPPPPPDEM